MGCGVQSVLTPQPSPGVRRMLRWCVGSWDPVEPSTPYYKIRESIALECGLAQSGRIHEASYVLSSFSCVNTVMCHQRCTHAVYMLQLRPHPDMDCNWSSLDP